MTGSTGGARQGDATGGPIPSKLAEYQILPTAWVDHERAGRPYVVVVRPDLAARLRGNLRLAYVEREFEGGHRLGVLVHVADSPTRGGNEMACDQTVRNALGLPSVVPRGGVSAELIITPVAVGPVNRARNVASGLVGRRYLLLRAAPPRPADMEKRTCSVRDDDLIAMGCESGGRILAFGVEHAGDRVRLLRRSIQVLPIDADAAVRRAGQEVEMADQGWDARYKSAQAVIGADPDDLGPIWIDLDYRDLLGLQQLSPVLVRRDSRSAFSRDTQDFGVALLASLLALQGILDPLMTEAQWSAVARGSIVVLAAIVLSLTLIVWRLRSDLR